MICAMHSSADESLPLCELGVHLSAIYRLRRVAFVVSLVFVMSHDVFYWWLHFVARKCSRVGVVDYEAALIKSTRMQFRRLTGIRFIGIIVSVAQ